MGLRVELETVAAIVVGEDGADVAGRKRPPGGYFAKVPKPVEIVADHVRVAVGGPVFSDLLGFVYVPTKFVLPKPLDQCVFVLKEPYVPSNRRGVHKDKQRMGICAME